MPTSGDDFIPTIASDDDVSIASQSSDEEQENQENITSTMHPQFQFENDDFLPIQEHDPIVTVSESKSTFPAREEEEPSKSDEVEEEVQLQLELARVQKERKETFVDAEEKAKEKAFYDQETQMNGKEKEKEHVKSFREFQLCRPLLKAVHAMGFTQPTAIQQKTIPIALLGKDICASAQTGSGKTAAFLIPIVERLHLRNCTISATRVLIICPVRELATQCHNVLQSLSQCSSITSALVVGGLSSKAQEVELRKRPDVVICTPGRMIDHLRNSLSIHLDDLEILVLDEADRLLELGFMEEIQELVRMCPKARQTMLFSATMTAKIDQLITLSMKRPVRISTDPLFDVSKHLIQEFVRIRPSRESDRDAILLALCTRTFQNKTIVFMETKIHAHRTAILFRLSNLKASELHGDLSQEERLKALEAFRDGKVDILLCTDVAARGIDVKGVRAVINYEMPKDITTYVHRVGRTARAGRVGRAVTLTSESRRLVMKEVTRHCSGVVQSRSVPDAVIVQWNAKIQSMQSEIARVLQEEKIEKRVRKAEEEASRAQNLIEHHEEIHSRPPKTWFMLEKEKKNVKQRAAEQRNASSKPPSPVKEIVSRSEKLKKMNRKKRRLFEIREREEELLQESQQERSSLLKKDNNVFTEKHVAAIAKRIKRTQMEHVRAEKEESIAELADRKRQIRDNARKVRESKAKAKANANAKSGENLFENDLSNKIHGKSNVPRVTKAFEFKEKISSSKRHQKKSNHAFKSKARFKRR